MNKNLDSDYSNEVYLCSKETNISKFDVCSRRMQFSLLLL